MLVLNKVELLYFFFLACCPSDFVFSIHLSFYFLGRGVLDCLYFTTFLTEVMLNDQQIPKVTEKNILSIDYQFVQDRF